MRPYSEIITKDMVEAVSGISIDGIDTDSKYLYIFKDENMVRVEIKEFIEKYEQYLRERRAK